MPEEVSKQELLSDLENVSERLESAPSRSEYDKNGQYSARTFDNKFGGFTIAREKIGLKNCPERPGRISDAELLRDIQSVGSVVDGTPTESDIVDRGEFALDTYVRRFGSWKDAVSEAGYEPNENVPEGPDNPAYIDGNSHNYSTKEWRIAREKALERDSWECLDCGMSNEEHKSVFGRAIEVHHIKRVESFDNVEDAHFLDNLATLCRPHHREYEALPNERAKELLD